MAKANDTTHNPFHRLTIRKANPSQNPPLDTTNNLERLIEAVTQEALNPLIFQSLFVGIQHLAKRIHPLTQTPFKPGLEKEV